WGPDCILLDFTLPDMTGLEFIDRLRESSGEIPCALVMLTGIADERIAVRAVNAGATDYLPKSENMETVLEHSIYNAIDKHRLEKELEANRLELARSEHLHRSLMKALPQLVWTADAECRLLFGNRQWWEYVGDGIANSGEFEWNAILQPEDRDRWWRNWRECAASRSGFDIEVRLLRAADRQFRWHLVRAVRLDDALDAEWLATCTDIEDQKRAEQAMAQRQKWDSIGLLAGGIAHDFNNLLVGILGGASYVSDVLPATHSTQPILRNIVSSGERAAHLTRQLLAYAGKGAFFIQQVDLSASVEQTCDLVRPSIPNNVQLNIQTAADLPRIETDSGQVQQVVMNLVLNAVEAIPQNQTGVVFVRTFAETGTERSGAVVLEVRDTGRGMDPETQSRIFDPFFTTKFTGRGLGLAAVQGILRSSGASINVTSSPGKGSTFRVSFRVPASQIPAQSEGAATPGRISPNTATVLVIDDEAIVRQVCQTALESAGCSVLLAEDGQQGLQCLEEKGSEIQLILLDLGMPGMNGRQVLERVRATGRSIPVIVFSGYSEKEVTREFEGLRISSFLQKPFSSTRLAAEVAGVLNPRGRADAFQVAS
ncbi:MAG TPA: response regulator, partial [Bryobacteraceae bacterium]|nr:response regulator [Bryobacteraceae bacterium]